MADVPHHLSDIDTWKHPDRNFFVFMIVSILFGFFGMDHFYLRSFATGTQKFIMNLLTFGLWYWWDLIQIIHEGDKVRTEGLNSPFDWIRGIGRGVFRSNQPAKDGEPLYVPKKSYLLYAFLAIFFGWLGADKFYIGEFFQGVAKLFSCLNIFLFLFGLLWSAWDGFHAFFMMESVLKDGITPPLPYSMLFTETTPGDIFLVNHVYDPAESLLGGKIGIMDWIAKTFHFPPVPVFPLKEIYKDLVVPFLGPDIPAPPTIPPLSSIATTLGDIARNLPPSVAVRSVLAPETLDGRSSMEQRMAAEAASPLAVLTAASPLTALTASPLTASPLPAAASLPAAAPLAAMLPSMVQRGGGASDAGSGPGPVIAGTLTALVLAGGLKGMYDIISKQYG